MDSDAISRRRLIYLSTIGLTTGLAGCSSNGELPDDAGTGEPVNPPDEDTADDMTEKLQGAALVFHPHPNTYSTNQLPVVDDRPSRPLGNTDHAGTSLFSIEVQPQTAVATLENTTVKKDSEFRLHVRNATERWKTVSSSLDASETIDPETHELKFDISHIDLPRGSGGLVELVVVDEEADAERLVKQHQFVGIEHKNGTNWINSETFNYTYRWAGSTKNPAGVAGVDGQENTRPAGYIETRDDENERTVFLATRTPTSGEVFGVSCHIKHQPYDDYVAGDSNYKFLHDSAYECKYATEISHLRELSQKTYDVLTQIGVTRPRDRFQALGDMVQMIPYGNHIKDTIPSTVVLYDSVGDCSNKTNLYSAIVLNEPWNTKIGFVDCYVGSQRHFTVGIDVNDLNIDTTSLSTVAITSEQVAEGYPDTEYAIFDMTYNSDLGSRSDAISDATIYDVGNYENHPEMPTADPPDY